MNTFDLVAFIVMWFGMIPLSAALISDDIAKERIGQAFSAWIDRRFRGDLVGYAARCPRCISHWVILLFAAFLWRDWHCLPIESDTIHSMIVISSVLASIRITRGWLE
jgi:hypothetical protein